MCVLKVLWGTTYSVVGALWLGVDDESAMGDVVFSSAQCDCIVLDESTVWIDEECGVLR